MKSKSNTSRYARQTVLPEIGKEGQEKLRNARLAVVGCGALGSVSAEMLVRMGVGRIRLIDRDMVDITNLSRQSLFDEDDARNALPKAATAALKLKAMNSEVEITSHVRSLDWRNISELLGDCDLIVDGTDNFETRFLINEFSLKSRTPWVYGGAISTRGMAAFFWPGKTPCFVCLLNVLPAPEETATCETAGVMAPIIHWVSGLQTALAVKYLVKGDESFEPLLYTMDVWRSRVDSFPMEELRAPGSCPTCREKTFAYLTGKSGTRSQKLCGRNAVQLDARNQKRMDLNSLREKLSKIGEVKAFPAMLKFKIDDDEIIVFQDGRAIVQGTTDVERARSILAKYIGG